MAEEVEKYIKITFNFIWYLHMFEFCNLLIWRKYLLSHYGGDKNYKWFLLNVSFPKQVFKKHLPFNKFWTFIPVLLLCKIVQNDLSCYEFGNLKGNFLKNLKNYKFYWTKKKDLNCHHEIVTALHWPQLFPLETSNWRQFQSLFFISS